MNDAFWVFKQFGIKAGVRFVIDSVKLDLSRRWNRNKVPSFVDLTDKEFVDIFSSIDISHIEEAIGRVTELCDDDIEAVQVHYFDNTLN
jgi:hypothetical protein